MAEIRAQQLKQDLQALVELGHDQASFILASVSPRDLRTIQQAGPTDWLPIELELELCRRIHATAGDDGIRAWGLASLRAGIEGPLLKPMLETTIRMFGLSPAALLRLGPLAWRSAFREAGRLDVTMVPGQAGIARLCGLPEVMFERAFLLSIAGCLETVFAVTGHPGAVQLVEPVVEEPRFILSWADP
jgi:hypothetical protein